MYNFALHLEDKLADDLKRSARIHHNTLHSEIVLALESYINDKSFQLYLLQQQLKEIEEAIERLHN